MITILGVTAWPRSADHSGLRMGLARFGAGDDEHIFYCAEINERLHAPGLTIYREHDDLSVTTPTRMPLGNTVP